MIRGVLDTGTTVCYYHISIHNHDTVYNVGIHWTIHTESLCVTIPSTSPPLRHVSFSIRSFFLPCDAINLASTRQ